MLTDALFLVWYSAIAANALVLVRFFYRRSLIARFPILFSFLAFSIIQSVMLVDRRNDFESYRTLWSALIVVSFALQIAASIEALDRAARRLHKFGWVAGVILSASAVIATVVAVATSRISLASATATTMDPLFVMAIRMVYVLMIGTFGLSWAAFPQTSETRNLLAFAAYLSANTLGAWILQVSSGMPLRWFAQFLIVGGSGVAYLLWLRLRSDEVDSPGEFTGTDEDDDQLRDEIRRRSK